MHALIRTDASASIGTGHLVRCLNLAQAMLESDIQVSLACAEAHEGARSLAAQRGIPLLKIDAGPYGGCSGPLARDAQTRDAAATARAARGLYPDWIIVDHYNLDSDWERAMRGSGGGVAVIDDLADRDHDCDILVDHNVRADAGSAYDARVPAGCERLFGPRYAMLDAAFAAARAALPTQRDAVLVSFGGSDPAGLTLPVVTALLAACPEATTFDVVVGGLNRDLDRIRAYAARRPRLRVHHATSDMAGLMSRACLYVGAGGTTSWERCCVGLAGVVVAVAANQVDSCVALEEAGSHVYLGRAAEVPVAAIAQAAAALLQATPWRERLATRSAALVDGRGAARLAARFAAGKIHMREARASDEALLFAWRNHPEVRRFSASDAQIDAAGHAGWLTATLANPDRHLLIGEDRRGPVGVVRYDVTGGTATVSVYLVPERLGSGLGAALLAAGERWLAARRTDVTTIAAVVDERNVASRRLFAGAGYRGANTSLRKTLPARRHA